MKKRRIGMRAIKTALAVALSIWIAESLGLQNPAFAGYSAVVSMTTYVYESYHVSWNRMVSTTIGAFFAVVFFNLDFVNPLSMFIGVLAIIYICNRFKWPNAISLACIVFVTIMLYSDDGSVLDYSLHRLFDTFVGLLVGFFINLFFFPPKPEKWLVESYFKCYTDSKEALKQILSQPDAHIDETLLVRDLHEVSERYRAMTRDRIMTLSDSLPLGTVESVQNALRISVGLIIEVGNLEEYPPLSEENKLRLRNLFSEDFHDQLPLNNQAEEMDRLHFNYEIAKIVELLKNVRKNLDIFEEYAE